MLLGPERALTRHCHCNYHCIAEINAALLHPELESRTFEHRTSLPSPPNPSFQLATIFHQSFANTHNSQPVRNINAAAIRPLCLVCGCAQGVQSDKSHSGGASRRSIKCYWGTESNAKLTGAISICLFAMCMRFVFLVWPLEV